VRHRLCPSGCCEPIAGYLDELDAQGHSFQDQTGDQIGIRAAEQNEVSVQRRMVTHGRPLHVRAVLDVEPLETDSEEILFKIVQGDVVAQPDDSGCLETGQVAETADHHHGVVGDQGPPEVPGANVNQDPGQ